VKCEEKERRRSGRNKCSDRCKGRPIQSSHADELSMGSSLQGRRGSVSRSSSIPSNLSRLISNIVFSGHRMPMKPRGADEDERSMVFHALVVIKSCIVPCLVACTVPACTYFDDRVIESSIISGARAPPIASSIRPDATTRRRIWILVECTTHKSCIFTTRSSPCYSTTI
jgi:hypothetical protein